MYSVLDKDTIELKIVPYIPKARRGFAVTVPLSEIINAILYKLKTGVQWFQLPVKAIFTGKVVCWQSVYYHYRKWSRCGFWKACWIEFLKRHRSKLDLSSVDLDGSHTPAIRGGEQVDYQGRKKRKTTNSLYLTDRHGLPLAMSEPIAGNHNDLYNIEVQFEKVTANLEQANIAVDVLFLNADAGFDSKELRKVCSGNICFNKRNSNHERDEYFDKELIGSNMPLSEPTHGWMGLDHSLIDMIQPLNLGKVFIT
ncbi:hypothetical protein NBRC110019_26190 [Neptunitalea chrysea]|uniref:Insertion element IS402-like domain-containing protein n=1 Tax=Neptunitalea chrysea TaxID=1647581 RepID=A0A9W6B9B0_9FLAO|nr:hypothetical protein NBRC110019_26190 [Neptunitalea chrysea]